MKRQTKRWLLIGLVLLGVAVLWWLRPLPSGRGVPVPSSSGSPVSGEPPPVAPAQAGPSTAADEEPERPANVRADLWTLLMQARAQKLSQNQPVVFHARAIDQDGRPVAGAKLRLNLHFIDEAKLRGAAFLQTRPGDEIQERRLELVSDSSGRFMLAGERGTILYIESLSADGYLWDKAQSTSFDYRPDRHDPKAAQVDHAKGHVFHLWKKGETEPLVPISYRVSLSGNVSEVYVNLLTGPVTDSNKADLVFGKTMLAPDDPAKRYDRRLEIVGLSGAGLAWTDSPYAYLAPEDHYESSYGEDRQPSQKDVQPLVSEWRKRLFVRSRNGRLHAGVMVHFMASDTWYEITGYVNPAGSPSLEPDPAKFITDDAEIRRLDEVTRQ